MHIDTEFPGGNLIVEKIEGNTAYVKQDIRDTEGHWFYWSFRVTGAEGRTVRFEFTNGRVVGVHGPAVSSDEGKTWRWLGAEWARSAAFTYGFGPDETRVRFAVGIPYQASDLAAYVQSHAGNAALRQETFCHTRKGREVELLRAGRLDGKAAVRIFFTVRHHCCESTPNFMLEGILNSVLADDELGAWFRERVEFCAVPLLDKDGVEEGDQGKNRKPYDHNRDYDGEPIYPEVRAVKETLRRWSAEKALLTFDLHGPYLHGRGHECFFFVLPKDARQAAEIRGFAGRLERETAGGPVPYACEDDLPWGKDWNTSDGPPRSCSAWARTLPNVKLAASTEFPYADARGTAITAETTRDFGRRFARALKRQLEEEVL